MVKEKFVSFSFFSTNFLRCLAKGFRTVIRSCASRSTLGVAQGCRYFVDEVGLEVAVCVSFFSIEKLDVIPFF